MAVVIFTIAIAIYALGIWLVFQNAHDTETIAHGGVTQEQAAAHLQSPGTRSGAFFRVVAEKLQFAPHRPSTVSDAFKQALTRAPADSKNFTSYGYYLYARDCCKQELASVVRELTQRAPSDPERHSASGFFLLKAGFRDAADVHLRRAIELQPSQAPRIYKTLERSGISRAHLLHITPLTPAAYLQLSGYLGSNCADKNFEAALVRLNSMNTTLPQKISVADVAYRCKNWSIVEQNLQSSLSQPELKILALQRLVNMAAATGNWEAFKGHAEKLEAAHFDAGNEKEAAIVAVRAASLLTSAEGRSRAKERFLRAVSKYPNDGQVYYNFAIFSRNESQSLYLHYLKLAAERTPENATYRNQLARGLVEAGRFTEAQRIFGEMIREPESEKYGYEGLAKTHIATAEYGAAIAILQEGIGRLGRIPELLLLLAQANEASLQYHEAAKLYQEYARIYPRTIEAYNRLGDLHLKMGEIEEARDYYQKSLSNDPRNTHAQQSLSRLRNF